jgi:hypothetical protein
MAMILGTVISVTLETDVKKQGGGSFKAWELVYKTNDGEVRTLAKPVTSLRFNAKLKAGLESLTTGDPFTAETEKNAQGFLDVKGISKGQDASAGVPEAPKGVTQGASAPKATNTYQASSYPTAEERAKTQNHIIRQSSLAQAVATLSVGSKGLKPDEVLAVADVYVAWVKNEKTGVEAIAEMEDDIPY